MPDSSVAGYLLPTSSAPENDASLEAILQHLVVGVTGLPGTMVRPAWQAIVPQQPDVAANWCAIQIMTVTPDANPVLEHDPVALTDTLIRHEQIAVLMSFYGIAGQQYASLARDGIFLAQNHQMLRPYNVALDTPGVIRTAPEQINEQWVRRFDLELSLNRKLTRVYSVLNFESALIDLSLDTPLLTETVSVTEN